MSTCINKIRGWLGRHEKTRQWLWFVMLWLSGLAAAMALAYPIKMIVKFAE